MKRNSKKGFTLVELVIVIAVIAILAAVLIPTISNVIQNARDAAYAHDRTTKQTEGVIEKIDNPNYMTWEDFEDKLAEALAKAQDSTAEKIQAAVGEAIKNARFDEPGITDAQIKDIIERTLEGQLTDAQVKAIVEKAVEGKGVSAEDVNKIVNKAISNLPKKVGVTKDEMTAAIKSAVQNIATGLSASEVEEAINAALAKFDNDGITDDQLTDIVSKVLAQLELNKLSNDKVQQAIDAASATKLDDQAIIAEVQYTDLRDVTLDVTYLFDIGTGYPVFVEEEDGYWFADYEVSFNANIPAGSVVLGGIYGNYNLGLPACDPENSTNGLADLPAGKTVKLLRDAIRWTMTYNDVATLVKQFTCGVKNFSPENVGKKLSVKLCLYKCVKLDEEEVGSFTYGGYYFKEDGDPVVCAAITYTLEYNEATEPSGD